VAADSADLVLQVVLLASVGRGHFVEVHTDLEDLDLVVLEESHVLEVDTNLAEVVRQKAFRSQEQRRELLGSHVVHQEERSETAVAAAAVVAVVVIGIRQRVSRVVAVKGAGHGIVGSVVAIVVEDVLTEHWLAIVRALLHQCDLVARVSLRRKATEISTRFCALGGFCMFTSENV